MAADAILRIDADTSLAQKSIDRLIRKNEAQINKINRSIGRLGNANLRPLALGKLTGQANEFASSMEAAEARVLAFGATASVIASVGFALRSLVKNAVEVEKALLDIQVVLNATNRDFAKLSSGLFDVAAKTGQSFRAVSEAATEFARQGLSVEETLTRTRNALILTRLSGLEAASSVEALTAAVNGFTREAVTTADVVNRLAKVDADFAVSSADLANALSRAGAVAQDAGVSFNELLATVTSLQQTTARGGNVIGNGLKSIFTRIQRTESLDQLEALGIAVRDVEGNIRPAIQILSDLAQQFDRLGDAQRAQISEQLAGVFQINQFKALIRDLGRDFSIYEQSLRSANSTTDEAVQRNEKLNQSLDALAKRTVANFTEATAKIGELTLGPAIRKLFGSFNEITEGVSGFDPDSIGSRIGEGILRGIGEAISGPGVILAGALAAKFFGKFFSFVRDAGKNVLEIGGASKQVAQIQQQINQTLQTQPELYNQILSRTNSRLSAEQKVLNVLKQQTAEEQKRIAISNTIGSQLARRGVRATPQGLGSTRGFVPNFVQFDDSARRVLRQNPDFVPATQEAILRESRLIPEQFIRVTSDPSLKSPQNPGLAIVNDLQEPRGLSDVRAANGGTLDKFAGKTKKGFVPNFLNENEIRQLNDLEALVARVGTQGLREDQIRRFRSLKSKLARERQPQSALQRALFGGGPQRTTGGVQSGGIILPGTPISNIPILPGPSPQQQGIIQAPRVGQARPQFPILPPGGLGVTQNIPGATLPGINPNLQPRPVSARINTFETRTPFSPPTGLNVRGTGSLSQVETLRRVGLQQGRTANIGVRASVEQEFQQARQLAESKKQLILQTAERKFQEISGDIFRFSNKDINNVFTKINEGLKKRGGSRQEFQNIARLREQALSQRFEADLFNVDVNRPSGLFGIGGGRQRRQLQAFESRARTPEQRRLVQSQQQALNQNLSQSRLQALFGASFALPILGGLGAQLAPEGRDRRRIEGIVGGIGTGASIAAIAPGPLGVGAGIAVGGFTALKAVLDNVVPSLEELAQKTQELNNKQQTQINSISNFVAATSQIQELIQSGAPQFQIEGVRQRSIQELTKLPEEIQKRLREASGDIFEQQRILSSFATVSGRQQAGRNIGLLNARFQDEFNQPGFLANLSRGNIFNLNPRQVEGLQENFLGRKFLDLQRGAFTAAEFGAGGVSIAGLVEILDRSEEISSFKDFIDVAKETLSPQGRARRVGQAVEFTGGLNEQEFAKRLADTSEEGDKFRAVLQGLAQEIFNSGKDYTDFVGVIKDTNVFKEVAKRFIEIRKNADLASEQTRKANENQRLYISRINEVADAARRGADTQILLQQTRIGQQQNLNQFRSSLANTFGRFGDTGFNNIFAQRERRGGFEVGVQGVRLESFRNAQQQAQQLIKALQQIPKQTPEVEEAARSLQRSIESGNTLAIFDQLGSIVSSNLNNINETNKKFVEQLKATQTGLTNVIQSESARIDLLRQQNELNNRAAQVQQNLNNALSFGGPQGITNIQSDIAARNQLFTNIRAGRGRGNQRIDVLQGGSAAANAANALRELGLGSQIFGGGNTLGNQLTESITRGLELRAGELSQRLGLNIDPGVIRRRAELQTGLFTGQIDPELRSLLENEAQGNVIVRGISGSGNATLSTINNSITNVLPKAFQDTINKIEESQLKSQQESLRGNLSRLFGEQTSARVNLRRRRQEFEGASGTNRLIIGEEIKNLEAEVKTFQKRIDTTTSRFQKVTEELLKFQFATQKATQQQEKNTEAQSRSTDRINESITRRSTPGIGGIVDEFSADRRFLSGLRTPSQTAFQRGQVGLQGELLNLQRADPELANIFQSLSFAGRSGNTLGVLGARRQVSQRRAEILTDPSLTQEERNNLINNLNAVSERFQNLSTNVDQFNLAITALERQKLEDLNISIEEARLKFQALNSESSELVSVLQKQREARARLAELNLQNAIAGGAPTRDLRSLAEQQGIAAAESGDALGSISSGIRAALIQNQNDTTDLFRIFNDGIKTTKDQISNALFEVSTGAKSAGDALRDIVLNVANNVAKQSFGALTNRAGSGLLSLFGGIFGGGKTQGLRDGGKVFGGSGVKDDVPAFLNGGEFVIKRSSASRLGMPFLEALNSGRVRSFQNGGFNTSFDFTKDIRGASLTDLTTGGVPGISGNVFRGPLVQGRIKELEDLAAFEKRREAFEREQKSKFSLGNLLTSIFGTVLQVGLAGFGGGKGGAAKGILGGGGPSVNSALTSSFVSNTGARRVGTAVFNGLNVDTVTGPAGFSLLANSGGAIPQFRNGGSTDSIPAKLTAGEFVVNKQAVRSVGVPFLNEINKRGRVPGFQDGGLVSPTGSLNDMQTPLSNLDNLAKGSSTNNNVNISINIDRSGGTSVQQEGSDEQSLNQQQQSEEDTNSAKELSKQLENVVISVIEKHSRRGGFLDPSSQRRA